MTKLLMADNGLCNKEAGEALANMLASNTTLKELDVSNNTYYKCDSPGFAQELAIGVKNNRALTSLDISNQVNENGWGGIGAEGAKHIAEAIKVNVRSLRFVWYRCDPDL